VCACQRGTSLDTPHFRTTPTYLRTYLLRGCAKQDVLSVLVSSISPRRAAQDGQGTVGRAKNAGPSFALLAAACAEGAPIARMQEPPQYIHIHILDAIYRIRYSSSVRKKRGRQLVAVDRPVGRWAVGGDATAKLCAPTISLPPRACGFVRFIPLKRKSRCCWPACLLAC
jgi:hypothetical protein